MKTKTLILIAALAAAFLSASCDKESPEKEMRIQIAQDVSSLNSNIQTAVMDSISFSPDKENPSATAYLSIYVDGQQMHNHFTQKVTYSFERDANGVLAISSAKREKPRLLEQTPILPGQDDSQ